MEEIVMAVSVKLAGTKLALGNILPNHYFNFSVYDENDNLVTTGTNRPNGEIDFNPFNLTNEGEYLYTITEDGLVGGNWTVDPSEFTAKVTVTEEHVSSSELAASIEYPDGYPIFKDFYLDPEKGLVEFPCITFTEEGVYTFTIKEVLTPKPGWELDDSEFEVTITITDDGKGNLVPKVEYHANNFPEFVNRYNAKSVCVPLSALKKTIGAPLYEGQFDFVVVDENGNVVAEASNNAPGK
jgi:pilin isopeptide linkage protein